VSYQELHQQKRIGIGCSILMIHSVVKVNIHTGDKMEPAAPKQFGPSELVLKMRRLWLPKEIISNIVILTFLQFMFCYIKIFGQKAYTIVKINIQTKSWRGEWPYYRNIPFLEGNLNIWNLFLKIEPMTTLPKFGKPIFLFWTLKHYLFLLKVKEKGFWPYSSF